MGYRDTVLADAPLLYWKIDGSDTATDISGNGHDGNVVGDGFRFDDIAHWEGYSSDLAFEMDGSSYITVMDLGDAVGDDSLTFEFIYTEYPSRHSSAKWGIHDSTGGNFLAFWDATSSANQWNLPNTNALHEQIGNELDSYVGQRLHLTIVYDRDASVIRLFINGVQLSNNDYPLATDTPAFPDNPRFTVGMEWDGDSPSDFVEDGAVKEIALFRGRLSDERIAAHYEASLAHPSSRTARSGAVGQLGGWNPSPLPVPNPRAIGVSGQNAVIGVPHQRRYPVHFDQIDGSGANGTPTGGVSDPARMGVIAGTVLDIQAQPVSRRVRVHERATGRIVRETWSDVDGKYRFTDLDPRRAFYVMAFDHTLQKNAVVSDNVHSEVEDSP